MSLKRRNEPVDFHMGAFQRNITRLPRQTRTKHIRYLIETTAQQNNHETPEFAPDENPFFRHYTIRDFLKLKSETAPGNKHVRTAGYVMISRGDIYLKTPVTDPDISWVKVKMNYLVEYPQPGKFIEVFGMMQFKDVLGIPLPYINVYFHRELTGSFEDYDKLCKAMEMVNS